MKVFFTINTEGVFYFDWQGGVVTEYRHHVQEVLKRHTAITGRRENLNDTLIERIHLKRYNSINSTLVWLCIYFLRWQMYTNLKAFFFASYMYDVPIQNYSSRVFPVDLGKRIFFRVLYRKGTKSWQLHLLGALRQSSETSELCWKAPRSCDWEAAIGLEIQYLSFCKTGAIRMLIFNFIMSLCNNLTASSGNAKISSRDSFVDVVTSSSSGASRLKHLKTLQW